MIYVGVIDLAMGGQEVALFSARYLADNWALAQYHKHIVADIVSEIPGLAPVRFETLAEGEEWFRQVADEYHDTHRDYFGEIHFDYTAYPRKVNTSNKMYGKVITLFHDAAAGIDWKRYNTLPKRVKGDEKVRVT